VPRDRRNGTTTQRKVSAQTDAGKRKPRRSGRKKAQLGRFLETVGEHGEFEAAEEAFESTLRAVLRRRAIHLLALVGWIFSYLAVQLTID
jgi:hypothetical protein